MLTFDSGPPREIISEEVSQNGTEFTVLRAQFDLEGETSVEMRILPEVREVQGE